MDSPTCPTLDPDFEEYLTRRLQEYADAAAEISSPTSSLHDGDGDSGIHGNTWSDMGDSPGSNTPSMLSTASCPVSPAPQRARIGYRPQRPLYDPTRGILKSITEGNTRRLTKLLGRRHSNAASQEDLCAPLVQAIRTGQDRCVLSLLSAGANPNGTDDEGKTPLYLVMEAAGGNPEILRALLKAKASPDQATWNLQHTPLHLAAKKGYQVGVKQLLAAGARPDKKDAAGNTALMLAAKEGHINIVRALLREGASAKARNLTNESVLHFAAKGGSVDCLNELLQAGANPNERDTRGQTPLLIACKLKHTKAVEILLDYDCDVNGQDTNSGKTALHWAIQNGELNIVTELLDAGADPNIKDKNWTTPFLLALGAAGSRDILELLLHSGCDVRVTDRSFNTALHLAASEGQADLLPALVEAGIMVDIKGPGGVTSLMLAAYGGHLATVKQLLQYGAGPDLMDRNRASALTYAIISKANDDVVFEILKMLIRSNCQLNNCANLKKLIQQLSVDLGEGIDVEERLYSPIEVAYLLGKTAVFMMLIKAGANANTFTEGPSSMMLSPKQHSDNEQRNQWYLLHCLKKEQKQIKSLVELCRRPALEFLSKQYKGHSFTMPQKIARLPFTDRVKSFLNYDDLDEVQSKYNVTLRDKQQQKKTPTNGNSRIPARDSGIEEKKRVSGTQSGLSSLRTSFRRSNTGLNRNSSTRQSLPIGYGGSQRGVPAASKPTPEKTPTRRSMTLGDSSQSKPRRTSLNLSSTSRLSTSRDDSHGLQGSTPSRPTSGVSSRISRPSSASSYSSSGRVMHHNKTASSNNLELSHHIESRMHPGGSMSNYGSLRSPRKTGREAEFEKLEQAYDQLRTSMIAAGSISDMSSSSSSLCDSTKKRRGRYRQLDPTQMLMSPSVTNGSNQQLDPSHMVTSPASTTGSDSVFFNGELSPRSGGSDDSSNSSNHKARVSASSPTESKSSGEERDIKQRSILRNNNLYNNNFKHFSPPVNGNSINSVITEEVNGNMKDEWGLKSLRAPQMPKAETKPKAEVVPIIMDDQEKKVLENIMKEAEDNLKKPLISVNPDERPLTPMSEETKKAIYDKRWACVPNPALSVETADHGRIPRSRSASESDQHGMDKRLKFSQREPEGQIAPRSSLRTFASPTPQEKKEVRFSPSSEKVDERNIKRKENIDNLNLSDEDYLNLKRWGTMTLDDPEVLDNSENFTSSRSLLTPTGKRIASITGRTNNTSNNLNNNNRPLTSSKSTTSPRSSVSSPSRQMAESVSKVRSWSTSPGNVPQNRNYGNTNGQITNKTYQDENYRNQNGYHSRDHTPSHDVNKTSAFNRGSNQYSSVRVRGAYGARTQPMAVRDNTASLDRASRKRTGMRARDSYDVTSDSPLTSPAEKKELRFGPKNDHIVEHDVKKDTAGSKIKMAFLRSRSFRQ